MADMAKAGTTMDLINMVGQRLSKWIVCVVPEWIGDWIGEEMLCGSGCWNLENVLCYLYALPDA